VDWVLVFGEGFVFRAMATAKKGRLPLSIIPLLEGRCLVCDKQLVYENIIHAKAFQSFT